MTSTIGLLPQLSGAFVAATNADWDDVIAFLQPAPNDTQPLDITGIAFRIRAFSVSGGVTLGLSLSTDTGTLVNGGALGTLAFAAPASLMGRVPPGGYAFDLLAIADGRIRNLFQKAGPATLTVNKGLSA